MAKAKGGNGRIVTSRTSTGLCDALFDEFDRLRNDESDAHRASAIAKIAIQIIATKRLELDAAQLVKGGMKTQAVLFTPHTVRLGAH